jgi:hypothetical protein
MRRKTEFNPSTIISYELRITSYVKLVVYNITGKEVITLVNEEQSAGIYEVDYNGMNYSSGIYFYSLLVNGVLIETKRMTLLK